MSFKLKNYKQGGSRGKPGPDEGSLELVGLPVEGGKG